MAYLEEELFYDSISVIDDAHTAILDDLIARDKETVVDDIFALVGNNNNNNQQESSVTSKLQVQLKEALDDEEKMESLMTCLRGSRLDGALLLWESLVEVEVSNGSAASLSALKGFITRDSMESLEEHRRELLSALNDTSNTKLVLETINKVRVGVEELLDGPVSAFLKEKGKESFLSFFESPSVLLLGEEASCLEGVVLCGMGSFLLREKASSFVGCIACFVKDQSSSFKQLQALLLERQLQCPVLIVGLYPSRMAKVPMEVVSKWCQDQRFLGPVMVEPTARNDVAAALSQLASRIHMGVGMGMPLPVVAGGVDATATVAVSEAGVGQGEVVSVEAVLQGGVFVGYTKKQESSTVVCPLDKFTFSSSTSVKAMTAAEDQPWLLPFAPGDVIHVLSKALGKRLWLGFCNGAVGFFPPSSVNDTLSSLQQRHGVALDASGNVASHQLRKVVGKLSTEGPSQLLLVSVPENGNSEEQLMTDPPDHDGLNALVALMRSESAGIQRQLKKKAKGKKLKKPALQCFDAQEAIQWMLDNQGGFSHGDYSRNDALASLQQLVNDDFIYNVNDPLMKVFSDDTDLWRFWSDGTSPPLNVRATLQRSVMVRHPSVVVRALLEAISAAVLPHVRMTSSQVELDYYRLRELKRWTDIELGVCELQRVSLASLVDESEKIAFWINLHNLLAIHSSICNKGVISGGWKGGFYTDYTYLIHGNPISLFQIHSGILRQNSRVNPWNVAPFAQVDPFLKHVVTALDPRILFALSGCFRDSPAVVCISGASLNQQLNTLTADYLEEYVSIDFINCVVTLPGLMAPFMRDFGKDNASVLMWISKFLSTERRQLLAFLSKQDITVVKFTEISFDMMPPKVG